MATIARRKGPLKGPPSECLAPCFGPLGEMDHRTSCGGNTFFLEAMNMTNRILRLPDVLNLTGLARSTIYAKISAGQFPKPFKLGQRAVGWLEADVHSWIETKVLESESTP